MHISREKQIHRKTEECSLWLMWKEGSKNTRTSCLLMVLLKAAFRHTALLVEKPSEQEMKPVYRLNLEARFSHVQFSRRQLKTIRQPPVTRVSVLLPELHVEMWECKGLHGNLSLEPGSSRPTNRFTLTGWGTPRLTAHPRGDYERKVESCAL